VLKTCKAEKLPPLQSKIRRGVCPCRPRLPCLRFKGPKLSKYFVFGIPSA